MTSKGLHCAAEAVRQRHDAHPLDAPLAHLDYLEAELLQLQLLARGGRYLEMYTRQNEVAADLFLAPGEGGRGGPAEAAAEEPPESEAG